MTLLAPTRRGFLGALLAAPLIVKASSLMAIKPVKAMPVERLTGTGLMAAMNGNFNTDDIRYRMIERWHFNAFHGRHFQGSHGQ